jgi:integration host factor subunit alpha
LIESYFYIEKQLIIVYQLVIEMSLAEHPALGGETGQVTPDLLTCVADEREDGTMTLTKAHIVESLFGKNIFTKSESAQVIETLFEIIKETLEEGEDVLISGFGKFSLKEKNQRRGRNPQTGDPIMLAPRKVVTFKCSGVLRDKINKGSK